MRRKASIVSTILFLLNFSEMLLEVSASRVLSPIIGNSQYVWISIIGIVMLGGACGNVFGGWQTKKHGVERVPLFQALCGICCVLIYAFDRFTDKMTVNTGSVVGVAITFSIALFFLPAFFLSSCTPFLLREYVTGEDSGKKQGFAHAVISLGSICGTFFGGFVILPKAGLEKTVLFLTVTMFVLSVASVFLLGCGKKTKLFYSNYWVIFALGLVLAVFTTVKQPHTDREVISVDTEYTRIIISETEALRDGIAEPVRLYQSAGAMSSGTFIREELRNELIFDYMSLYDQALEHTETDMSLMIGGAAYAYPKYYIAHFPEKYMDVVEIDPMSLSVAKKYFYMDELLGEPSCAARLGLFTEDGRLFVSRTDKKYGVVMNDAFSGGTPVASLATDEAVKAIKSRLEPGGIYAMNVLGALEGDYGMFLRSELKVLEANFRYVRMVPVEVQYPYRYQNYLVFASDAPYTYENEIEWKYEGTELFLTDDYCPVDQLVGTAYNESKH